MQGMFDESLDLADVLAKLRRADDSLGEFIAPLWPGRFAGRGVD